MWHSTARKRRRWPVLPKIPPSGAGFQAVQSLASDQFQWQAGGVSLPVRPNYPGPARQDFYVVATGICASTVTITLLNAGVLECGSAWRGTSTFASG